MKLVRHVGLLRPRWRSSRKPVLIRLNSTTASTKPAPKTFDQIAKEMAQRSRKIRQGPKLPYLKPDFAEQKLDNEVHKPLLPGDLVILNLEPFVILKTPNSPLEKYLLASHVGMVREAKLIEIDSRLMSLIPSYTLTDTKHSLFAPDNTTGAPLKVTAEEEQGASETSLEKPSERVVSWWVYKLISLPLRHLYESAEKRACEILPLIRAAIERLQEPDVPTVLPLKTFIETALNLRCGDASIVDFYAARICLEHASLENKFRLDLSYISTHAILILSRSTEKLVHETLSHRNQSKTSLTKFITEYARGNLPMGPCESRAIEILRERFPEPDYIDSAVASELLQLPRGGIYENAWFHWIFAAATNGNSSRMQSIASVFSPHDSLASLREQFDQPVYCIDGPNAEEIDDGISLERLSSSKYRLGIHIAHPSAFTDVKAAAPHILPLTSSVYLSNDVTIPMLPPQVVEPANLVAGTTPKPVLTLFADFDIEKGTFDNVVIKPLVVTKLHNLLYESISRNDAPFDEFYKVANLLLHKRYKNGAFSFKTYLEDTDNSVLGSASQCDGEVIVTEFMNLANHLAATYCKTNNIPIFYRQQFLEIGNKVMGAELHSYRESTNGLLGLRWGGLTRKGQTSVTPGKHVGIGVDAATRFTSPLRRLDDLIVHAQINAHLTKTELPFTQQDLRELKDWMQLSQELSRKLSRWDKQFDGFSELAVNQEVVGVADIAFRTASAEPTTPIYLPKYGISAGYTGDANLKDEEVRTFVVTSVSAVSRTAEVALRDTCT